MELIVLSWDEPEAFGAPYERHAETLLRFFVRRTLDAEAGSRSASGASRRRSTSRPGAAPGGTAPTGVLHLEADLPAADGARVVAAIRSVARRVPVLPGQEGPGAEAARRADALTALCTRGGGTAATVVIHAGLEAACSLAAGAQAQDGAVVHPASLRRIACTGVVENLHEDHLGRLLHRHRHRRRPPAWMERQVRWRDGGCTFPGCGTMAFTEAHHIRWVRFGGATTLENLALVCSFHHRLVHEHGWGMRRLPTGELAWYRPDGRRYEPEPPRAGPAPP